MTDSATIETAAPDYIDLTANLVSAYVSNNNVPAVSLAQLIATTHAALTGITRSVAPPEAAVDKPTPAQIRKSMTHEALISFEDGKPYKTLRRHLTQRGLTPDAYREKWGLPRDYPMTAPAYSEMRAAFARSFGLGRKRTAAEPTQAAEAPAAAPKRAGRPRKAKDTA